MNINDINSFIASSRWIFAKTMPQWPHWYVLKKEVDPKVFEDFVMYIRKYGREGFFYKKRLIYLHIDGYKYWSMGAPLGDTILINRAEIEKEPYDLMDYSSLFTSPEFKDQDKRLFQSMGKITGSVLDVGCGSGLLTDHPDIMPNNYTGIDPSAKMLQSFSTSKPEYQNRLFLSRLEDARFDQKFDCVVSLYGSGSYVNPAFWGKLGDLLTPEGRYFIMFYKPDYDPVTYQLTGVKANHHKFTYEELSNWFSCVTEFDNYFICSDSNRKAI